MTIEPFLQLAIVVVSGNNACCSIHFHLEKHGDSFVTKILLFPQRSVISGKDFTFLFSAPEEATVCFANRKIGQIC